LNWLIFNDALRVKSTCRKVSRELSTDHSDVGFVANIVCAYISKNSLSVSEVPSFIKSVHGALKEIASPIEVETPVSKPTPAVPINKSVTKDFVICLEDGLKFKSIKRHLRCLGMTPAEYRAKWGLPNSYPMAAPSLAAKRSALAKTQGLGNQRKKVRPNQKARLAEARPLRSVAKAATSRL
jgi:predicted transcriptional regulator